MPVTAVTQVQRQVSELRKALGSATVIETRAPGYALHVEPGELDLQRFEQLSADGRRALAAGDARQAATFAGEALALSSGGPLSDLGYESFAQVAIARLEELLLAARELRIDARIALGEHSDALAELEELTANHPHRERLREQQMLALYRAGRQAEALDVYRRTRTALAEELGLEPTPALQALERAILAQDPSLEGANRPDTQPARSVLVLTARNEQLDSLLRLAEPLIAEGRRDLLVAKLVTATESLETEARMLNARRDRLPSNTRVAAFTPSDPADDAIRLVRLYDVDLLLADAPQDLDGAGVPNGMAAILERSPADVALLSGTVGAGDLRSIAVPFGGGDHDWAALEFGAWLANATGSALRLVGTKAVPLRGQRDASRLLADASIAVQRLVGIASEPLLADATTEGLVNAVQEASLVVVGISTRWRVEGLGATRRALIRAGGPPVLVVHRGTRPGVLAPTEARTRFTWSLEH